MSDIEQIKHAIHSLVDRIDDKKLLTKIFSLLDSLHSAQLSEVEMQRIALEIMEEDAAVLKRLADS